MSYHVETTLCHDKMTYVYIVAALLDTTHCITSTLKFREEQLLCKWIVGAGGLMELSGQYQSLEQGILPLITIFLSPIPSTSIEDRLHTRTLS